MISLKRIKNELNELINNQPTNFSVNLISDDNIYHWSCLLIGPTNTPYENGMFKLDILLSNDYPFLPPKISFKTKLFLIFFE